MTDDRAGSEYDRGVRKQLLMGELQEAERGIAALKLLREGYDGAVYREERLRDALGEIDDKGHMPNHDDWCPGCAAHNALKPLDQQGELRPKRWPEQIDPDCQIRHLLALNKAIVDLLIGDLGA